MQLKKAILSAVIFTIAVQFIHQPEKPHPLPQFSAPSVITAPKVVALEEFGTKEYYFKPPTDTKWNYAPGNCTFGTASWTYVPAGLGNANTWDDRAMAMGYKVTSTPGVGSVAVDNSGYYGHVALTIDISGDYIKIREMNVYGLGVTNERWVHKNHFDAYIYF